MTLRDGALSGVEALVRWQHPQRGLLNPGQFIDITESTGLIHRLCAAVLDETGAQVAMWARSGHPVEVAVNLSARQLVDPTLATAVAATLSRHALDPGLLTLEVTETALVTDPDTEAATLHGLKALGVSLSVDDFGTGYASLTYLQQFPLDELRIDRSFIASLPDDDTNDAIVGACVKLARDLGLRSVAEGVETQAQRDALLELGCDQAQGYLFSRPLAAEHLPFATGVSPMLPIAPMMSWLRLRDRRTGVGADLEPAVGPLPRHLYALLGFSPGARPGACARTPPSSSSPQRPSSDREDGRCPSPVRPFRTRGKHEVTSLRFEKRLAEIGAVPSIGIVGSSFDNALAATFTHYDRAEVSPGPAQQDPWKSVGEVELASSGWQHRHSTGRLNRCRGDIPPPVLPAGASAATKSGPLKGELPALWFLRAPGRFRPHARRRFRQDARTVTPFFLASTPLLSRCDRTQERRAASHHEGRGTSCWCLAVDRLVRPQRPAGHGDR